MDNTVACNAGGPGSIPSTTKCFFYLGGRKNGASLDNWCDVDIIIIIILATPFKRQTWFSVRNGIKNVFELIFQPYKPRPDGLIRHLLFLLFLFSLPSRDLDH